MRSPSDVERRIEKRVDATWHFDVSGESLSWPQTFTVVSTSDTFTVAGWPEVQRLNSEWRQWAMGGGVTLTEATKMVGSSRQRVVTHVEVPNIHVAVTMLGRRRIERYVRAGSLWVMLTEHFPDAASAALLRAVEPMSDTDIEILLSAAHWFIDHDATGLTPRQVPVLGMHSKWLNAHRREVLALCGKEDLGLVTERPQPLHFTYLDSGYLASGRRRHDSVVPGDQVEPAYRPATVIVCENKDSATQFPDLPDAIAVQGAGKEGPKRVAAVPWMRDAERLLYWGDIDAAGFEIVNMYRAAGANVMTMLMDTRAQQEFAALAAATDAKGIPLKKPPRKNLARLTDEERSAYENATRADVAAPARIEQERIPLDVAAACARWGPWEKYVDSASTESLFG